MERIITVGLTLLLVSLTAPNAKANTQTEAQQRQAQPAQTQPQAPIEYSTNTSDKVQAKFAPEAKTLKLSERDRIVRQYQTQTVIPAK